MSLENDFSADAALCIYIDNSALAGSYYSVPASVPAASLSQAAYSARFSYAPPSRSLPYGLSTSAASQGFYEAGERVAAAVDTAGGLRGASNGWWALPAVGPSGACAAGAAAFAAFREDVPPTQCARAPAALDADTCDAWGGLRMLGDLRLAKFPTFDTLSVLTNYVTPTISRAWNVSLATGARTPLTSAAALTASTAASLSAFASGAGGCRCDGVLVSVAYRVTYSSATRSIAGVEATAVFTSVEQGAAACAAATRVSTPLTWSLTWVDSAATAAPLTRSGAPGYLLGAPVLAGKAVAASGATFSDVSALASTDKVAISRSAPFRSRMEPLAALGMGEGAAVAGLAVRGAGAGGACAAYSAATAAGADAAWPVPVTFGEDMALSCSLSVSASEFVALCAAGATGYLGLWAVNATGGGGAEPSHVGQLGNADPAKYWQWVAIGGAGAAPAGTVDANFASCKGLTTSLNVEFLWAYVGEAGNPQAKVVAVRKRWGTDTWVFSREDSRVLTLGADMEKQTFTLTTTVTWTQYPGQAPQQLVAAAPTVVPPLPSDLWYPFGQ